MGPSFFILISSFFIRQLDFRTTILPHRDRLYRLALSITLDTAEAEDVVQDTMLRAWERREEWTQIKNMEAWLSQMCKNLAIDHEKKRNRTVPLSNSEPHPSSEADHDVRESFAFLSQLITQLPPPQDDIVRLRDIEGFSYREIAVQLNLSEDQVRVYLHRARTKLREQYVALQGFGL